jgi:hypothetical protein
LAALSIQEAVQKFVGGAKTGNDYDDRMRYFTRRMFMRGRRPAVTQNGYICMVPRHSEAGDFVFAFAGGVMLYVVRHAGWFPERFNFIGEAYVHGLMDMEWRSIGSTWPESRILLV